MIPRPFDVKGMTMVRTLGTAALVTAALLSPAAAQQRSAQSKEPVETGCNDSKRGRDSEPAPRLRPFSR